MKIRRWSWLLALVLILAIQPTLAASQGLTGRGAGLNPGAPTTDGPMDSGLSDGRYTIEFHQFGPGAAAAVQAAGGRVLYQFPEFATIAARLPDQALRGLRNHPDVKRIDVDPRRYPLAVSGPALASAGGAAVAAGESVPYGIPMVQANDLAFKGTSAANRKVCIIDSGYSLGHQDLPSNSEYVTGNDDLNGAGVWYRDGSGHGTHVAGTIAAIGDNGTGVVGVLPGADSIKLHIVRVFGDNGSWAYSSDLANALGKCRTAGANVVSMSLGGSFPNPFEESAFNSAYNAGVLSIAAAGNAGNTSVSYPAGYGSVVSVAAIDSGKTVAGFSQKNGDVELAAPGVDVLSTVPFAESNTLTVGTTTYQGNYIANAARTTSSGVTGGLVDGGYCTATSASWSGKVVLCQRGSADGTTVTFHTKVSNVQTSGGVAAVIYNNAEGNFSGTLGDGNASDIPAISLSQADGQAVLALPPTSNGTVVSQRAYPASGYEAWSGTSMATPHVSGVAALIWSYNTAWTNDQVRKALQATAQDLGSPGRDTAYGFGLVQAKAALDALWGSGGGGAGALAVTVATNKLDYRFGETATITVTVTDGTNPVSGASVSLNIKTANSRAYSASGTTGANGAATFTFKPRKPDGTGTYTATATATKTGYTGGTKSTTFTVR